MRKRFLLISTIIVLSAFTFAACGKKSPSSPESTNSETTTAEPTTEENTEKDTTEEEKPVATATSEESTKEQTKTDDGDAAKIQGRNTALSDDFYGRIYGALRDLRSWKLRLSPDRKPDEPAHRYFGWERIQCGSAHRRVSDLQQRHRSRVADA